MNPRTALFLTACLGLALPPIQAVQLGDPREAVISEMGEPIAERLEGDSAVLSYPQGEISMHASRVSRIELREPSTGDGQLQFETDIDAIKLRIAELEARLAAAEARAAAAERAARDTRSRSSFFGWTPHTEGGPAQDSASSANGPGSRAGYRFVPAAREGRAGTDAAQSVPPTGRSL